MISEVEIEMNSIAMASHPAPLSERYTRLVTEGGFFRREAAVFELRGADSLDLIQRISTNDVAGLAPGTFCKTIFVTEKGRFVSVATLVNMNGSLLLIADDHSQRLKEWIE